MSSFDVFSFEMLLTCCWHLLICVALLSGWHRVLMEFLTYVVDTCILCSNVLSVAFPWLVQNCHVYNLNHISICICTCIHVISTIYLSKIWVFPKTGVPQNGWFTIENSIKMDDLGVPLFSETSIYGEDRKECWNSVRSWQGQLCSWRTLKQHFFRL